MDPWNKSPKKSPWEKPPQPPNLDEVLNKLQSNLNKFIPKGNTNFIVIVIIVLLWLGSGFFVVEPEEEAAVTRFGSFNRIEGPGWHYHLPFPIEKILKENVTTVRRLEIGFRTIEQGPPARYRQVKKESLMLTGDENIVDVQFTVQYKIMKLEDYLFRITEPMETVKDAAESTIREVIGNTLVDDVLTTGKSLIETQAGELLQTILNSYQAGIHIENVKLQDVHPPDSVKEAFKDVASAKEDREKIINEAYGYRNNIIPKARGEAKQIINQSEAYAKETVLIAEGKAQHFISVNEEYRQAKDITRKRILLETMEKILPTVNKVITDPQAGKNLLPFLPIRDFETGRK